MRAAMLAWLAAAAGAQHAVQHADGGVLRVAFLLRSRYPSETLRAAMLAVVMRQHGHAVERFAGTRFSVRVLDYRNTVKEQETESWSEGAKKAFARRRVELDRRLEAWVRAAPASELPHVVISVKERLPREVMAALGARCVVFALDVVDKPQLLSSAFRPKESELPPRTVLLVQSRNSSRLLSKPAAEGADAHRRMRLTRGGGQALPHVIVPHQMTNLGMWRVRPPADAASRPLRTAALLVGGVRKMPSAEAVRALAAACCVHSVQLSVIFEQDGDLAASTITRYRCAGGKPAAKPIVCTGEQCRAREAKAKPAAADSAKRGAPVRPVLSMPLEDAPALFNASGQRRFHDRPVLDDVDVAILWPNLDQPGMVAHSPPTRLLYWWSHGVPCIFFPYGSYLDAARRARYELPGGRGLPMASTAKGVEGVLGRLAGDPAARVALAKAGLAGARLYSGERVAARLVRGLGRHVAEVQRLARAPAPSSSGERMWPQGGRAACLAHAPVRLPADTEGRQSSPPTAAVQRSRSRPRGSPQ